MGQAADIVRTGRKYEQVLDGARKVFLADGFEGASVDDIARAAGVSKATLYAYFPDKRILFMEMANAECERMSDAAMNSIDEDAPPQQVLSIVAHFLTRFLLSELSVRMFRICVAESDRFPELGRAFYAAGPEQGRANLGEYLKHAVARGELVIPNIEMATDQFSEMCTSRLWLKAVFGMQSKFSEDEINTIADEAVTTFMARYGA